MKLQKFMLHSFESDPVTLMHLDIPIGSVFKKAIVLNDGMYMLYEVPELVLNSTRLDTYTVLKTGESTEGYEFIDTLVIFDEDELTKEQKVIIFSIYKTN